MTANIIALPPPPRPGLIARLKAAGPHSLAIQAAVLLALLCFAAFVVMNVVFNVARLNINVGFGFLSRPAGFEMAQSLIDYPQNATYFRAFLSAFINTTVMAVVSIVFATFSASSYPWRGCGPIRYCRFSPSSMSRSSATCRCCCSCSSGISRFSATCLHPAEPQPQWNLLPQQSRPVLPRTDPRA